MSIFSDARVTILLADFANVDAQGKINAVGAGIGHFMMQQGQPATSPFSVVVVINVPQKHVGSSYAFSLELRDVTRGAIAQIVGQDGQPQPLRAQQSISVEPVLVQQPWAKPDDALCQNIIAMNFPTGLPLTPGTAYEWKVTIDGQSQHWAYRFHVLAFAPGMVIGGPDNPPAIPGVGTFTVDGPPVETDEDEEKS